MTSSATIAMTPRISVAVSAVTSSLSWRSRGGSGKSSSPGVSPPMPEPLRHLRLTLGPPAGERLDKALAAAVPEGLALSRSRLQALILEGAVATAEGTALEDPRLRLAPGTEVVVSLPDPTPVRAAPEPIPLDVVYEDPDLIVIDKPPGLVVHPAPGAPAGDQFCDLFQLVALPPGPLRQVLFAASTDTAVAASAAARKKTALRFTAAGRRGAPADSRSCRSAPRDSRIPDAGRASCAPG